LNSKEMQKQEVIIVEETEGGRRPSGVSSTSAAPARGVPVVNPPDPEVPEKTTKRRFTASYKLKILSEVDRCKTPGEIGALIRREGLYSSYISRWRKQRDRGALGALSPRKRGPKEKPVNPLAKRIAQLERENRALRKKLEQAETIIEVQKKVSNLLGIELETPEKGEAS
jgi:transposase